MTEEEFVNIVSLIVAEGSNDTMHTYLTNPPGRNPSKDLLHMSSWYKKLDTSDQTIVNSIVSKTIETSIFNFLCLLDGVTKIDENDGKLKLIYYASDGIENLISDGAFTDLHDIFINQE